MTEDAVEAIEEVNRIRRARGLGCIEQVPEIARAAERHCQYYMANTRPLHRPPAPRSQRLHELRRRDLRRSPAPGRLPRPAPLRGDGLRRRRPHVGPPVARLRLAPPPHPEPRRPASRLRRRRPLRHPGLRHRQRPDAPPGKTWSTRTTARPASPDPSPAASPPSRPPPPGRGWPSGYPVTLYAAGLRVHEHQIFVDGTDTPLPHEFLTPEDPRAAGLLIDEFMLYTFTPPGPPDPLPRPDRGHPRRQLPPASTGPSRRGREGVAPAIRGPGHILGFAAARNNFATGVDRAGSRQQGHFGGTDPVSDFLTPATEIFLRSREPVSLPSGPSARYYRSFALVSGGIGVPGLTSAVGGDHEARAAQG